MFCVTYMDNYDCMCATQWYGQLYIQINVMLIVIATVYILVLLLLILVIMIYCFKCQDCRVYIVQICGTTAAQSPHFRISSHP